MQIDVTAIEKLEVGPGEVLIVKVPLAHYYHPRLAQIHDAFRRVCVERVLIVPDFVGFDVIDDLADEHLQPHGDDLDEARAMLDGPSVFLRKLFPARYEDGLKEWREKWAPYVDVDAIHPRETP